MIETSSSVDTSSLPAGKDGSAEAFFGNPSIPNDDIPMRRGADVTIDRRGNNDRSTDEDEDEQHKTRAQHLTRVGARAARSVTGIPWIPRPRHRGEHGCCFVDTLKFIMVRDMAGIATSWNNWERDSEN